MSDLTGQDIKDHITTEELEKNYIHFDFTPIPHIRGGYHVDVNVNASEEQMLTCISQLTGSLVKENVMKVRGMCDMVLRNPTTIPN